LRGGHAVDERGWSGFGRVGFLRIYREQPRCIRDPLGAVAPHMSNYTVLRLCTSL
jgi:hypothetical protein